MSFPVLPPAALLTRLDPPVGKVRVVVDTDAYNEIDDQFALTLALLSPERLSIEAIYAAPFQNERSSGPEDGMEKSYEEILRLLGRLGQPRALAYRGATDWMPTSEQPRYSLAVDDLIRRASVERPDPLYVVAIGAPTNVASALVLKPELCRRMVVIWLGGNAGYWPSAAEFNLKQDIHASRVLFDCGVPLVHVPCLPVTDHLCTTQTEIERFVRGRGQIGDYLADTFAACYQDHTGRSRAIWDLGPIAWLLNPNWAPSVLSASPILTSELTWSLDQRRHLIREVRYIYRDPVFVDLFEKLERHASVPR